MGLGMVQKQPEQGPSYASIPVRGSLSRQERQKEQPIRPGGDLLRIVAQDLIMTGVEVGRPVWLLISGRIGSMRTVDSTTGYR